MLVGGDNGVVSGSTNLIVRDSLQGLKVKYVSELDACLYKSLTYSVRLENLLLVWDER
jgi:hypothetical protein